MKKITQQKRNGDSAGMNYDAEFPVFSVQKSIMRHTIFIDSSLDTVQDFRYAIQTLSMADENDEILVVLSSGGGSVDAAQALIHAMQQCPAQIVITGSGTIASAAAIILCASESFTLDPFASVMLHPCTSGYGGTLDDIIGYGEHQKKQTEDLLNYYTIGVLTEEELRQIHVEKKTFWLDTKDFTERFRRKITCQNMLSDYVDEQGIPSEMITPSLYVDLMKIMLREYEEQKAKEEAKPVRKARVKKSVVEEA